MIKTRFFKHLPDFYRGRGYVRLVQNLNMLQLAVIIVLAVDFVSSQAASSSDVNALQRQNDDPLKNLNLQCLECICQGISGCSPNVGCRREGHLFCGAFFISMMYWEDSQAVQANAPSDGSARNLTKDFADCATNRFCSEETVRGYMKRYAKDCDGDGVLTCVDFALIHKNGPTGCSRPQHRSGTYYSNFMECFESTRTPAIEPR